MYFAIDRFEGHWVIVVDDHEKTYTLDRSSLPASIQEGDVLKQENGLYVIDKEETAARREYIRQLEEKLKNK